MTTGQPRKKGLMARIRERLRQPELTDGRTCKALADLVGSKPAMVHATLKRMPDAYIDRWVRPMGRGGRYAAVWCVVTPPPNCPPPDKKR